MPERLKPARYQIWSAGPNNRYLSLQASSAVAGEQALGCYSQHDNYFTPLLNLKFIANVRCIVSTIAHMPSCLHVCRGCRIILRDSAFLISTEGVARQI